MKKFILVAFVAMATFSVSAQKFGVKAGVNLASYYGSGSDGLDSRIGFTVGGLYEQNLSGDFYLQPEVLLTLKGAKYGSGDSKSSLNPLYLDIPVKALYKLPLGTGKFTIAAGPYFGIGLAGKYKQGDASVNLFSKESGADEAMCKRFDMGVTGAIGYELSGGLFINFETETGFLKVFNGEGDNVSNNALALVVGYKF